jgi:hypothetical protein
MATTLRSLVSFIRKKVDKKPKEEKEPSSLAPKPVPIHRRRLSMSVSINSPKIAPSQKKISQEEYLGTPLLTLVLKNLTLHDMFLQYTEKEMSSENVLVHDLIQSYKRNKDKVERRRQIARYIRDQFLVEGSLHQLNIREETVSRAIEHLEMNLLDDMLFNEIEREVENTLSDSLIRFSKTSEFANFLKVEVATVDKRKSLLQTTMIERRRTRSFHNLQLLEMGTF